MRVVGGLLAKFRADLGPLTSGLRAALRSSGVQKLAPRRQRLHTGETVHVPILILFGAAGGLLRGALDVYTRFVSWQADRRAHRQLSQPALEWDPLEPTATRNCPHCQQPVTIVALLATPEAARPSVPTAIPDIVPLRRTP